MSLVEQIGEELTRQIDRRKFLKRAAMGIFGFTAAWAVELTFVPSAEARNYCQYTESGCTCNIGVYCTVYNSAYCSGPNCASSNCVFSNISPHTGTSCWCTDVCCGIHGAYYYECCDCICTDSKGTHYCGCRQLVQTGGCSPQHPKQRP